MPTFLGMSAQMGVPNVARTMPIVRGFQDVSFEYPYQIIGITYDASANPLPNCDVQLFRTADDSYVSQYTSDANGYYAIPASNLFSHYLVAYLAGSPDVAGTTVNTLTGA
jgi:hypothetical protein